MGVQVQEQLELVFLMYLAEEFLAVVDVGSEHAMRRLPLPIEIQTSDVAPKIAEHHSVQIKDGNEEYLVVVDDELCVSGG